MKRASITEAKNNLSALIDGLKSGSSVLIVDRGRPVARLEPVIADDEHGQDGRIARLYRQGLVRPRRAVPPQPLFDDDPPPCNDGTSAVDAVLEERREGR
jgi:prevent-host-death family protein